MQWYITNTKFSLEDLSHCSKSCGSLTHNRDMLMESKLPVDPARDVSQYVIANRSPNNSAILKFTRLPPQGCHQIFCCSIPENE